MAYYSIDQIQKGRTSNWFVLLPPLFVTIVFAYSFILLQPHNQTARTSADKTSTPPNGLSQALASNAIEKLDTLSVQATGGAPVQTTTPQTNNLDANELQGADSDGRGANIDVPKTSHHSSSNVKVKSQSSNKKLYVKSDEMQY